MQINMHEAKTHLSRLVERAVHGEEIVIAKAGRPVARLIAYDAPARRVPGAWRGQIVIHDDFDDPLEEAVEAAFRGEAPLFNGDEDAS
jgi:prevent-host-death family protein